MKRSEFVGRFLPGIGLFAVGALLSGTLPGFRLSRLFGQGTTLPPTSLYVDPALPPAANTYPSIAEAMSAAMPGSVIVIAAGVYDEDVTFAHDNIHLIGAGQPSFDGVQLVGGTVIRGRVYCNSKKRTIVSDLGVDIRGTDQIDAITSGNTAIGMLQQKFERLTLVGKGGANLTTLGHALLCAAGGGNIIKQVNAYNWYHGITLRCSDNYVGGCTIAYCRGNSVIIKSAGGSGDASNNVVENCVCTGGPLDRYRRAGPIRLQAFSRGHVTQRNTIRNVAFEYSGEAAVLIDEVAGMVTDNWIAGVTCTGGGDNSIRAEFDSNGGTNNTFEECVTVHRKVGLGFRNRGGVGLELIRCISDDSGRGQQEGIEAELGWPATPTPTTNWLPSLST